MGQSVLHQARHGGLRQPCARPQRHAPGARRRLRTGAAAGPLGHGPARRVRHPGTGLRLQAVETRRHRRQALRPAPRHPRPVVLLPQGRPEEGGPPRRRRPHRADHLHRGVVRRAEGREEGHPERAPDRRYPRQRPELRLVVLRRLLHTARRDLLQPRDDGRRLRRGQGHRGPGVPAPAHHRRVRHRRCGRRRAVHERLALHLGGQLVGARLLGREDRVRRLPAAARLRHAGDPRRVALLRPAPPVGPWRLVRRGRAPACRVHRQERTRLGGGRPHTRLPADPPVRRVQEAHPAERVRLGHDPSGDRAEGLVRGLHRHARHPRRAGRRRLHPRFDQARRSGPPDEARTGTTPRHEEPDGRPHRRAGGAA